MKNKYFGRIAAFLIIFFSFTGKVFSQTHFEISPLYEFKNGCLNELVFVIFDDEVYKLSELNWNIQDISYMGGRIALSNNWFRLESSISGGFSKQSAKMYDSDWQDLPDNPTTKTAFSISENTLNSNYVFDSKATLSQNLTDWLKIGLFLQYSFDIIHFSAKNGYGWYGSYRYSQNGKDVSYDSEYAKFFAVGSLQGIDYYRITKNCSIGMTCCFTLLDRLQIKLETGVAPYTFVQSLDHHYSAGGSESYYRDEIKSNSALYSLGAEIRLRLIDNIHFGFSFSYNCLKENKGVTYSKAEEHGYTEMIFKDLDEYYYDDTTLSGTSGKWCTFTAYCSFVF